MKSDLIYTPGSHIPIGAPTVLDNGSYALTFKWKRGKVSITETVPIDKLYEMIIRSSMSKAENRNLQDLA